MAGKFARRLYLNVLFERKANASSGYNQQVHLILVKIEIFSIKGHPPRKIIFLLQTQMKVFLVKKVKLDFHSNHS